MTGIDLPAEGFARHSTYLKGRDRDAEATLVGKLPTRDSFRVLADAVLCGAKGQGHNDFKIDLARDLITRAFEEVAEGAAPGPRQSKSPQNDTSRTFAGQEPA